jgi:hypothetical protein
VLRTPGAPTRAQRVAEREVASAARLLLLAACAGCVGGEERPQDPSEQDPPLPAAAVPDPGLRRLAYPVPADGRVRWRGIGVVFPAGAGAFGQRADTISVLAAAEDGAPLVARLVRTVSYDHVMDVRDDAAEGAALEFGYEELGLPLLEVRGGAAGPEWLAVRWGATAAGEPLDGWVRNDAARVEFQLWSEILVERPLFFLAPDSIRFHESADGPRAGIPLTPQDTPQHFDYILHPLEMQGGWMRVEVVTPSDYCFDPEAPRRDTAWIRYLDDAGEPRVWYFTRGC